MQADVVLGKGLLVHLVMPHTQCTQCESSTHCHTNASLRMESRHAAMHTNSPPPTLPRPPPGPLSLLPFARHQGGTCLHGTATQACASPLVRLVMQARAHARKQAHLVSGHSTLPHSWALSSHTAAPIASDPPNLAPPYHFHPQTLKSNTEGPNLLIHAVAGREEGAEARRVDGIEAGRKAKGLSKHVQGKHKARHRAGFAIQRLGFLFSD